MSYSSDIKEELVHIRIKNKVHKLALLCGMTQSCATLRISRSTEIIYQSESSSVIKLADMLGRSMYELESAIGSKQQEHRRNLLYVLAFSGKDIMLLLEDTGILSSDDSSTSFDKHFPASLVSDDEICRLLIRGFFLGCGSCMNPSRGYHAEMCLRNEESARALVYLIQNYHIKAKYSVRRDSHIVYIKGDDVSSFLALIGANSAALNFENVRTERDFRNYINRTANCETANIGKTVNAGMEQLKAIEILEKHTSLESLPAPLYEAARLRLAHPEATLQELAEMAEIGKSGMNHRLARIIILAKEYEQ